MSHRLFGYFIYSFQFIYSFHPHLACTQCTVTDFANFAVNVYVLDISKRARYLIQPSSHSKHSQTDSHSIPFLGIHTTYVDAHAAYRYRPRSVVLSVGLCVCQSIYHGIRRSLPCGVTIPKKTWYTRVVTPSYYHKSNPRYTIRFFRSSPRRWPSRLELRCVRPSVRTSVRPQKVFPISI